MTTRCRQSIVCAALHPSASGPTATIWSPAIATAPGRWIVNRSSIVRTVALVRRRSQVTAFAAAAFGRLLDLVGDEDDQVLAADLLQPVRAARPGEYCRAGTDLRRLVVERHDAASAADVVDLVLFLLVVADAGAGLQRALAEDELHAGRLVEERVADGLASAVVRARLVPGDIGVVLDDVAALRLLRVRRRCSDDDRHQPQQRTLLHESLLPKAALKGCATGVSLAKAFALRLTLDPSLHFGVARRLQPSVSSRFTLVSSRACFTRTASGRAV